MDILVVDDHSLFLDGFCLLLNKLNNSVRITSFNTGQSALEVISQNNHFDLIILDLSIPDIDGISLFNKIRQKKILSPIVFVSATENINTIAHSMHIGASGFIPKNYDTNEMLSALNQVLSGEIYTPPELNSAINSEIDTINQLKEKFVSLTKRQKEVLQLISKGSSNKEIAEELSISEPTVKSHISIIFQTLAVSNRVECIRQAESTGII